MEFILSGANSSDYPNPTDNDVKVHVGGEDQQVKESIFTTAGVLVYTQEQTIEDITRKTEIDLSKQQTGTYVVVMESKTVRKTFKIIREWKKQFIYLLAY